MNNHNLFYNINLTYGRTALSWFVDTNVASKSSHVIETTLHSLPGALRTASSQETAEVARRYPSKAPKKPQN